MTEGTLRRPILLLALLILGACSGSRTPETARLEGIDFLVRSQNRDGSWGMPTRGLARELYTELPSSHDGFRQATTALACLALRRASRHDAKAKEALTKAMQWFHTHPSSKRPAGPVFYNNWAHLYTLQMAAEFALDVSQSDHLIECRRIMEEEIARLTSYQGADGGWGYYDFHYKASQPSGLLSTSFMTGAVLVALDMAAKAGADVPPSLVNGGFKHLAALRLGNGAYIYGIYLQFNPEATLSKPEGCLSRTQAALAGLQAHGQLANQDEIQAALNNFLTRHHFLEAAKGKPFPHESYYSNAGYYYFFGHYYASRNTRNLEDPSLRSRFGRNLATILARDQGQDGTWFDFPLFGYDTIYATALAVMALEELKEAGAF
ncbi:MAG: hypothetical protein AB7F75_03195 [Planctomycetota bacterium]